jgi:hypothetical protein
MCFVAQVLSGAHGGYPGLVFVLSLWSAWRYQTKFAGSSWHHLSLVADTWAIDRYSDQDFGISTSDWGSNVC